MTHPTTVTILVVLLMVAPFGVQTNELSKLGVNNYAVPGGNTCHCHVRAVAPAVRVSPLSWPERCVLVIMSSCARQNSCPF